MRYLLLTVSLSTLVLAGLACTDPCIKLGEQICKCKPTSAERESCNQQFSDQKSRVDVTNADDDRCKALIDLCDCNKLDTVEGKKNCGMIRP